MPNALLAPLGDAYLPFVKATWLHNFKSSPWAGTLSDDIYFSAYSRQFDRILAAPANFCLVAVNPEDQDQIFGFVVASKPLVSTGYRKEDSGTWPAVHYVFVKEAFRGLGIGKQLLFAAGVVENQPFYFTHRVSADPGHGQRSARDGDQLPTVFKGVFRPHLAKAS